MPAEAIAYCGTPPVPGELAGRFNGDPLLVASLAAVAGWHIAANRRAGRPITSALLGWGIAAAALLSPLCALSVALFSARVAQHMLLALVAAPLIVLALPRPTRAASPWGATAAFFVALWFWHMPVPYAATFRSIPLYWAMHLSLFGASLWLWRVLLHHRAGATPAALLAGTATSIHMGMLGALLTLSGHAWFAPHYLTTAAWHLSPLADQQLGGVLMWVPGFLLFLWSALRSSHRLWQAMEGVRA